MNPVTILNRINSYGEYQKKMNDFKNHIVKMMIGKKDSLYRATWPSFPATRA